ncbi:MAG: diacylglycerol/lipid kinase family protein [Gemmatimonadales bacterium]
MKATFIYNPAAGPRGRGRGLNAREIERTATAAGLDATLAQTRDPGDACRLAEAAAHRGADVIVAVGGDGTVHEVANGMLSSGSAGSALAAIPHGTGNDFARLLGFRSSRSLLQSIRAIAQGRQATFDVGRALGRYFVNAIGVGFGPEVVSHVDGTGRGLTAYLLGITKAFWGYEAKELTVGWEGGFAQDRYFMVEVLNGRTVGGGFKAAPEADPQDGVLDIVSVGALRVWQIPVYVVAAIRGTHTSLSGVEIRSAKRVTIEAPSAVTVHMDGELYEAPEGKVEIEIMPAALDVICAG